VHHNRDYKYDIAIVTVSDEPKILFGELSDEYFELIKKFIKKHKDDYIRMWKYEIGQFTLMDIIERDRDV
jgi:hypothetical protein